MESTHLQAILLDGRALKVVKHKRWFVFYEALQKYS